MASVTGMIVATGAILVANRLLSVGWRTTLAGKRSFSG
jgi:hypothetical protein